MWASFSASTADEAVWRTFTLLAKEAPLSHPALTESANAPLPHHYWAAVSPRAHWLRAWCRSGGPVAAQQILILSLRMRFLPLLWRRATGAGASQTTAKAQSRVSATHLRTLSTCLAVSILCEVGGWALGQLKWQGDFDGKAKHVVELRL